MDDSGWLVLWCSRYECWSHESQCRLDCWHCDKSINAIGESYWDCEDDIKKQVSGHVFESLSQDELKNRRGINEKKKKQKRGKVATTNNKRNVD
jgi:hypothetical protein